MYLKTVYHYSIFGFLFWILTKIRANYLECNGTKSLENANNLSPMSYVDSDIGYIDTQRRLSGYLTTCSLVTFGNIGNFTECNFQCMKRDTCVAMVYKKDGTICEICVLVGNRIGEFALDPSYNVFVDTKEFKTWIQGISSIFISYPAYDMKTS